MNAKRILVLAPAIAAIAAVAHAGDDPAAVPLVVSPAWLSAHLKDPKLVLLHVGDEEAYKKQHIAGARRVALQEISTSTHGDGLMLELPPVDDLRQRLEAIGISNDSLVVVYFGQDWVSGDACGPHARGFGAGSSGLRAGRMNEPAAIQSGDYWVKVVKML